MPKKSERIRKLKALKAGEPVKAPKRWFDKMKKKARKQYPAFGAARIGKVVGGIWAKATRKTKINIVKKYQK